MNVVLFGGNDIALLVAKALQASHNVTILDRISDKAHGFESMDVRFISGSGTEPDDLKLAEAHKADAFIASTLNDDLNILACLAAKGMGAKRTLAIVTRQRYVETFAKQGALESLGLVIDRVLWPQKILADLITDIVRVPRALETATMAAGRIKMVEYKLGSTDPFIYTPLKDICLPANTLVVGAIRKDSFLVPSGETMLQPGDKAVFMGTADSMRTLERRFSGNKRDDHVMIIGGGNVGFMVAEHLRNDKRKNIRVIEQDEERCHKLAKNLPGIMVLHGDGTDLELLSQEEAENVDVLVAVTDDDSKNLLVALVAQHLGIPKVITRVSRAKNKKLFERVGIQSALMSSIMAVQDILNWLNLDNLDHIASIEDLAEVVEITYPYSCSVGKIRDLGTPKNSLIGAITRKRHVIIPDGDTCLQHGDHLYIVTTPDNVETVHNWLGQKRLEAVSH